MKIARHSIAVILFVLSGHLLSVWYQFRNRWDYLEFAFCFVLAVALASAPLLKRFFLRMNLPQMLFLILFLFISLPWGEWLRLNFDFAREDWTRQIFHQTVFLYIAISFLRHFRAATGKIRDVAFRVLDVISKNRYSPWLPCLLFFCLSSGIAIFVMHRTPLVQDSAAHLFQAKVFIRGKLFAPAPPVSQFFSYQGDMLVMKDGRWFSMYPPAYSALLALFLLACAEWFLSPLLGAVTIGIWILYLRRWHSNRAAALFSWLSLFSPFLILMSSAVMVHSLELFLATSILYLCRRESERQARSRLVLFFGLMAMSILTRGFSLLPFLVPVLAYLCWIRFRNGSIAVTASIGLGILSGIGLLAAYQAETTGDPWLSGYLLEYPGYRYGFGSSLLGLVHTPARGLENISNNLLGLNSWLTGWYSGSLFFVGLFFLLNRKKQTWDFLLLLCCGSLILFYYFFVAQDLVFGPRFFYPVVPILLMWISRSGIPEGGNERHSAVTTALIVVCLVGFLPQRLAASIFKYSFRQNQASILQEEMGRLADQKTLLFLGERVDPGYVGWNDPFLRSPVLILRDFGAANESAQAAFPDHKSVYFGLQSDFAFSKSKDVFIVSEQRAEKPAGFLSLFELATAIEGAKEEPDQDCFDLCYSGLFTAPQSAAQLKFLETLAAEPSGEGYQKNFRFGLIHAARAMLLPKAAFEQSRQDWQRIFDMNRFRQEMDSALKCFEQAGETGKNIRTQLLKVQKRIDQNRDVRLQDEEILRFLSQKTNMFLLQVRSPE